MNVRNRLAALPPFCASDSAGTAVSGSGAPSSALPTEPARDPLGSPLWAGLAYLGLFLALASPWLAQARTSMPVGLNAADEPFIAYVLGWVANALAYQPTELWNAPINYPAPSQLAGSEHFLSSQLLFAPLYATTGEALLATNLVLFLTYPLAALAMQRLLIALGCSSGTAFVVGFAFALAPGRVPPSPHNLQFLNLYLPLIALSLRKLRESPDVRHTTLFGLVTALAVFSSFYTAVITAVVGGLWFLLELTREGGRRGQFVVATLAATLIVGVLLGAISLPYFEYKAGRGTAPPVSPEERLRQIMTQAGANHAHFKQRSDWLHLPIVLALGIVCLALGRRDTRRWTVLGLVSIVVAWLLGGGSAVLSEELGISAARGFTVRSFPGLGFFRYPGRLAVITGFGAALIAASAVVAIHGRLGPWPARAALTLLVVFMTATRVPGFVSPDTVTFLDGPPDLARRVRQTADTFGRGPLIELPVVDPLTRRPELRGGSEVRAMLRGLEHGLPLLDGHTGYLPLHRVTAPYANLQRSHLLRIVDATGLRWILLRPPEEWPRQVRRNYDTLVDGPHVTERLSLGGWKLLEVTVEPWSDDWIRAIREKQVGQDTTPLGTPLTSLSGQDTRGKIRARLSKALAANALVPIRLQVENQGKVVWPGTPNRLGSATPSLVQLQATWTPHETDQPAVATLGSSLGWDVPPGRTYPLHPRIATPVTPGHYDVTLRLAQQTDHGLEILATNEVTKTVEVLPEREKRSRRELRARAKARAEAQAEAEH